MKTTISLAFLLILFVYCVQKVYSQDGQQNAAKEVQVVVGTADTTPNPSIVVPPATAVQISLQTKQDSKEKPFDPPAWFSDKAAMNGLQSTSLGPWHLIVSYNQFGEDGHKLSSGVYEEFWASPKKYRRSYKSDDFNQTDYATEHGLFRLGDQAWPNSAKLHIREEIVDPFAYVNTLRGVLVTNVERTFGAYTLQCAMFQKAFSTNSNPTQYCFEPNSTILRYSHGASWFQTVYNNIVSFQGHHVAQDVEVTDGGKPYLRLHVKTIETIPSVVEADFTPPSDAIGPLGDRISGVHPVPIKLESPQWPSSLREQHFSVTVKIVIGKDGHVLSANAISGLREGYKACEDTVRKWVFAPYLVLDKPVEVESKAICTNN